MSESKHKPMKRDKLSVNTAKCGNIEIVVIIPCHPDDAFDRDAREREEQFTDRVCDCYNACAGMADPAAEIARLRRVEKAATDVRNYCESWLGMVSTTESERACDDLARELLGILDAAKSGAGEGVK